MLKYIGVILLKNCTRSFAQNGNTVTVNAFTAATNFAMNPWELVTKWLNSWQMWGKSLEVNDVQKSSSFSER